MHNTTTLRPGTPRKRSAVKNTEDRIMRTFIALCLIGLVVALVGCGEGSILTDVDQASFAKGGTKCYVVRVAHFTDINNAASLQAVSATTPICASCAAWIAAMTLRNLIHCVLSLAVCFLGVAMLFLRLGAEFVGFSQILVYIGAVAILILLIL